MKSRVSEIMVQGLSRKESGIVAVTKKTFRPSFLSLKKRYLRLYHFIHCPIRILNICSNRLLILYVYPHQAFHLDW